jgi:hypothetical protein
MNNENQNTRENKLFSLLLTHLFSLVHISLPHPFLFDRLKKSIAGVLVSMREIALLSMIGWQ